MKPEIQKVLRAAGLAPSQDNKGDTVSEKLANNGMSLDESVEELVKIIMSGGNENIRFNALRDALKMHGALKESAPQAPSFTIVIQEGSNDNRSVQGVNPILLPRQLLKTLQNEDEGLN